MKIDPKKTKIKLIVPCSLCEGRQVIAHVKEHPTGNTSAYAEPCSWCKQTGQETIEMTLAEFVAHLAAMREVNGNVTQDIPIKWKDMP